MPNLVWKIDMKVKDITREGLEIKPAQQTPGTMGINIDGKQVGTADAQTAQTIAQASKDGKLELDQTPDGAKPGQPQLGEEPANPNTAYKVDNSTGKPMAMSSPKPTAIVGSQRWQAITPEIEAKANSQGFRTVYLNVNGTMIKGFEGGDQKLGSKIIVSPTDYNTVSTTASASNPVRESDDELARWKSIAGV
jgi:hypothetical protein